MSLFDLLNSTASQLPGCLSSSIVSLDSGLPLATVATIDDDDAAAADAFHSDVFRSIEVALEELAPSESIRAIVIGAEDLTFVSMTLPEARFFWHVVTESTTTLGFTQAVMRKNRDTIASSVLELFNP